MVGCYFVGVYWIGYVGGGINVYFGWILNNVIVILCYVILMCCWFFVYCKIFFYYFNDSIFIWKSEEKFVVIMNWRFLGIYLECYKREGLDRVFREELGVLVVFCWLFIKGFNNRFNFFLVSIVNVCVVCCVGW